MNLSMTMGTVTLSKVERLDRLIEYLSELEKTEPERFSLRHWAASSDIDNLARAMAEWPERHASGKPLNCGTSACVVGHLPTVFPDTFRWGAKVIPTPTDVAEYPHVATVKWADEAERTGVASECRYGHNVAARALEMAREVPTNEHWQEVIGMNDPT